ncbi:hypothetical protein TrCOL_g6753 [Triparma columacea]|uniref:Uncharacterized protein n=1 Tax=Triparma columacea TaxID=722753 RepID=A0A9W7FYC4_9STRA|nr:hypothetical protein TrCOL_g6753 [Triparma columacea]
MLSINDYGNFLSTCKTVQTAANVPAVHEELAVARFGGGFLESVYGRVSKEGGSTWKDKIRQQRIGETADPTVKTGTSAKLEDYGVVIRWEAPTTGWTVGTEEGCEGYFFHKQKEHYVSTGFAPSVAGTAPHHSGNIELDPDGCTVSFAVLPESILEKMEQQLLQCFNDDDADPSTSPLSNRNIKRLRDLKALAIKEAYLGPQAYPGPPTAVQRRDLAAFLSEMLRLGFMLHLESVDEDSSPSVRLAFVDYATGTTASLGKLDVDYETLSGEDLDYLHASFGCGPWGDLGGTFPTVQMGESFDHHHTPVVASVSMDAFYCVSGGEVVCEMNVGLGFLQFTEWDVLDLGRDAVANTLRLLLTLAKGEGGGG